MIRARVFGCPVEEGEVSFFVRVWLFRSFLRFMVCKVAVVLLSVELVCVCVYPFLYQHFHVELCLLGS